MLAAAPGQAHLLQAEAESLARGARVELPRLDD
jgi:hypothetical protein